jgi:transcriptional regulator with XRE-family HTH domain
MAQGSRPSQSSIQNKAKKRREKRFPNESQANTPSNLISERQVTTYHWHMLNERLKNLRLAKGMTLQQVGDAFGISKVSVSTWESGKTNPDHKKLEKLAELFGSSVNYLITGVDDDSNGAFLSGKIPFFEWETIKFGTKPQEGNAWVTPLHCKPSKAAFATRYTASSSLGWQPTGIPAGSILVVDPESQFGPGDFILVELSSSELLLAKMSVTPENKKLMLRIDSLNFKPIAQASAKTIGTVLEWQMSGKLK